MVRRQAIRLFVLLATVLAFAVLVPMHLAEEHHGAAAETHEGDDHHQGDHTVASATNWALTVPVDLRPSALLSGWVDLVPEPQGLVIAVRADRLHDPPDPDRAASPPTPPRAPPSLRS